MSIQPELNPQERTWAAMCHVAAVGVFIVPTLGNVIGPLIVWLVKRESSAFVNDQGREAVNFQLSCVIYAVVSGLLSFAVVGIPLMVALAVFWVVEVIVASVNASNGNAHRYPLSIPFIK